MALHRCVTDGWLLWREKVLLTTWLKYFSLNLDVGHRKWRTAVLLLEVSDVGISRTRTQLLPFIVVCFFSPHHSHNNKWFKGGGAHLNQFRIKVWKNYPELYHMVKFEEVYSGNFPTDWYTVLLCGYALGANKTFINHMRAWVTFLTYNGLVVVCYTNMADMFNLILVMSTLFPCISKKW